jgi:hypothetical protein
MICRNKNPLDVQEGFGRGGSSNLRPPALKQARCSKLPSQNGEIYILFFKNKLKFKIDVEVNKEKAQLIYDEIK